MAKAATVYDGVSYTEVFYLCATGNGSNPKDGICAHALDRSRFNNAAYWANVDAVDGLLGPNDRLVVLDDGGDFYSLNTQNSGLEGKPITIQAGINESPIITQAANLFSFGTNSYITFDGFTLNGGSTYATDASGGSVGIIAKNLIINTTQSYGIYWNNASGIISNISGAANPTNSSFIRAQNCLNLTIEDITVSGSGGNGVWLQTSTNIIANRLNISHMQQAGVLINDINNMSLTGDDWTITDVGKVGTSGGGHGVYYNGSNAVTGVTLTLTDLVVNGSNNSNGIRFGNGSVFTTGSKIDGFDISNSLTSGILSQYTPNLQYKNGKSHDNAGDGIHLANSVNSTISNNEVYSNGGDGISTELNSTGVTIDHNKVYSNGTSDLAGNGDGITAHGGCTGQVIYTNLIYSNRNSGFAVVLDSAGIAYNNTVYNNGDSTSVNMGVRGGFYDSGTGAWVVKNNIFQGNYPNEVRITAAVAAASTFNYNQYYHVGNSTVEANAFTLDDGVNQHDWSWYHTTQGKEVNSNYGDPLMVNPSTDFNLQSTSPAINAGLDTGIANLLTDYAGKQRYNMPGVTDTGGGPLTYYDMGAYEYVTPPEPVLSSSSHPVQTDWYNDATPDMEVTNVATPSTTTYIYLVDQNISPDIALVKAGTVSASATFTISALASPGIWYVHVIGMNEDTPPGYSATYGTYKIQFDNSTPTGTVAVTEAITHDAVISLILNSTSSYAPISTMHFSNDGAHWSDWETYATSKDWDVTDTNYGGTTIGGNKTVYAQFRNSVGTSSLTDTATVIYDPPPTFGNLPGTTQQVDPSEGQLITTNPYIIQVKPESVAGIEKVEFLVDDALICTETVADANGVYSCSWDTARYQGTIRIIVYDIYGATATITREAIVDPSLYTTTLPQTGKR